MDAGAPIEAARRVEPELLDTLRPDDPSAQRSRRDIRRLNALMMQPGVMRRLLKRHARQPPRRLVDLGGGDGEFMLSVARGLSRSWSGVTVTIVDRHPTVAPDTLQAFARLGWTVQTVQAEAQPYLDALAPADDAVIVANLFMHHFDDATLRPLLAAAARVAPLFVACEPRRAQLPLLASRHLWAIGCGPVTRYDAPVSVRAGFRGTELSQLWPQSGWSLHEGAALLFTHGFAARRDHS